MDKILQECVMESEIDSGLRPLGCGFDGAVGLPTSKCFVNRFQYTYVQILPYYL